MIKADFFTAKLRYIAENVDTLYVYGAFGAHLREDNYERYLKKYAYNARSDRKAKIEASLDNCVFGFDCVCLIKSVFWGWDGDLDANYGGATYKSNDVPDIGANRMIEECYDVSDDFSTIEIGEFLWMQDHCGVYIGDGLAVECTPLWRDGVQITSVANLQNSSNIYNERKWTKHGKLPWVDYSKEPILDDTPAVDTEPPKIDEIPQVDKETQISEENPETTPDTISTILEIIGKIIKIIRKIFGAKK